MQTNSASAIHSTPNSTPGALKLKGACQYLGGISEITLRRLIERGLIKPNRALRHILISKAELDRFLAS
jgi:excisionase family DNA binding protein